MQAQLDADSQQQAQREQELAAAVANKEDALEQLTSQVGGGEGVRDVMWRANGQEFADVRCLLRQPNGLM